MAKQISNGVKKIVFDLETKNLFSDVGGRENFRKLDVSVVGVYNYSKNSPEAYFEKDFPALGEILKNADLIIGFNILNFDLPILQKYFPFDLSKIPALDIMDEIVKGAGHRVSLDDLASITLGNKKSADGLKAVEFWRNGQLEELKNYCLDDVILTRDIYEYGLKNNEIKFTGCDLNLPYTKILKVDWARFSPKSLEDQVFQSSFGF